MSTTKISKKEIQQLITEVINEVLDEESRPVYTAEQKRQFKESLAKFNEYGKAIHRGNDIVEAYKKIREVVDFAANNLTESSGEWVDNVTATRHVKRLKESMKLFKKTTSEIVQLQQRLESTYDDIGETLNRYYEIHSSDGSK